ncbi:MAG TPA: trigger factor [Opitutaceae bacterium]|nr:trigger factor [Opitutaceae bacterium]
MNIELKDISDTRKSLVVTLDKGEVDTEYQSVIKEIAGAARIPGFRPGKAPANIIERRYAKEIREEFKNKVVGRAYRDGLEKSKLDVLTVVEVQDGAIEPALSAAITFTVDVNPAFELPDYTGIVTEVAPTEPADAEVDAFIEGMRTERAEFKTVERAAQKGDYVKLSYEGRTTDDQPIAEIVADRPVYGKAPQTWEEVEGTEGLIPGLSKELAGMKAGDKKDARVAFPPSFNITLLAGREAIYAVEVLEVRERVLAELNEEFLKAHQVETVDQLKEEIRKNLTSRKVMENRAAQRRQVGDILSGKVNFNVPDSLVESETQSLLRQFIADNMRRGAKQEDFESHKNELFEGARKTAVARAKLQLILARIAAKEKIGVNDSDVDRFIRTEAYRSGQKPDKIAKDLGKDRNAVRSMQQAIVLDKTLDFLVAKATVTHTKAAKA